MTIFSGTIAYCELGDSFRDAGLFDEASRAYEICLETARQIGDDRAVVVSLGQLGNLAMLRGDLEFATTQHSKALEKSRILKEPQMEASAWANLGYVAQKAENWNEAERCFREALRIFEQIHDSANLVKILNNLASIAHEDGQLKDAEQWYLRTITESEKIGEKKYRAVACSNLAILYLSKGPLDVAEHYARRAVEIKETLDLSSEPWTNYQILSEITEVQGKTDEAAQWRRKAQDSFAVYTGAGYELEQFKPLVQMVVAVCKGNQDSKEQLDGLLQQMEGTDGNVHLFGQSLHHILNGETDFEVLRVGLGYQEAYIVRSILAQLAGEEDTRQQTADDRQETQSAQSPAVGDQQSQSSDAAQAVARIREQWGAVIQTVVAACDGNQEAAKQLAPFLADMEQKEDWRTLISVLRRIIAGERDPLALLRGLDETDTLVAGDALRGLGVDVPIAGQDEKADDDGKMISLEQFLESVVAACKPDAPAGLAEQMHTATRGMATQANLSPELRELGRVLNQILSGERNPDLSALHPQLAEAVRKVLGELQ